MRPLPPRQPAAAPQTHSWMTWDAICESIPCHPSLFFLSPSALRSVMVRSNVGPVPQNGCHLGRGDLEDRVRANVSHLPRHNRCRFGRESNGCGYITDVSSRYCSSGSCLRSYTEATKRGASLRVDGGSLALCTGKEVNKVRNSIASRMNVNSENRYHKNAMASSPGKSFQSSPPMPVAGVSPLARRPEPNSLHDDVRALGRHEQLCTRRDRSSPPSPPRRVVL